MKKEYIDTFDQTITPGYGILQVLRNDKEINMLEIGCDVGDTAVTLLSNTTALHLWSIDPYDSYEDWNGLYLDKDNRNWCKERMLARTSNFAGRHTHVEKYSDDAVNDFEDGFFDVIFIDGDHSYEQCLIDCRNYWPKLMDGGLFCGHDYNAIEGVRRAVNEFAQEINISQVYLLPNDVWAWQKIV